ncbi:MAG: LamG domain-containing protein [Bdellovibrionaceae bacterium]|nr:LamG domain-containing protein [Pseudobdellovibrionaceae bacterium]
MINSKRIVAICLLALELAACGGGGGGGSSGGGNDNGDPTPTTVTSGLVYQLDASKYDGSTFPATGCATLSWTDLIGALTGTLTGFSGCGATSGWNGDGSSTSPYRLVLDGTDDYVSLGTNTIGNKSNGASAVTIDFWVRYTSLESGKYDNNIFFVSVDGTKAGLWMNFRGDGANAGKVLIAARSKTSDAFLEATSTTSVSAATWTHLVGLFDFADGTLNLAFDGTVESASSLAFGSTTYTQATATVPDTLTYTNAANDFLNGEIAYFGVYNRELSSTEISQNCNALKDRFSGHSCN